MVNYTVCHPRINISSYYPVFNQVVCGFLTTVCVLLGTVGNIHSIKAVHLANFDKNRGVVLAVSLLALAIWDTFLLWGAFFYYGLKSVTQNHKSDVLNLITPFFHAFIQIANTASIWCVVSITIQRHSRVPILNSFRVERRKPSLSFIYCSIYRRHFRVPILLSLGALIVNIPAFLEVVTYLCYRMPEGRLGYDVNVSSLRLNRYYRVWYKLFFRMIVTSCGPNAIILLLTALTVLLLKGSNRSRRQLFQMSENLLDRYSSKETMQTLISIMLVVKFLLLRSLSFMIDIYEVATLDQKGLQSAIYFVDVSNFMIILNSATNCLIFLRGSTWLQTKIVQRNTMRRKKQLCIENLQSLHRVNLLFKSWQHALFMTNRQFGVRILYSMLLKNPPLAVFFNNSKDTSNGTPPVPPPTPACTISSCGNGSPLTSFPVGGSSMTPFPVEDSPPGKRHMIPVIILPRSHGEVCPSALNARTAEVVAAMPHSKKRSLDLLGNPGFHEVGDRIMHFMGELIDLMRMAQPDQQIIMRIRRVGALHQALGINFTSSAWKEFKSSTLNIIEECDFANDQERNETLEAWSSFLSVIIREMKMGSSGFGLQA